MIVLIKISALLLVSMGIILIIAFLLQEEEEKIIEDPKDYYYFILLIIVLAIGLSITHWIFVFLLGILLHVINVIIFENVTKHSKTIGQEDEKAKDGVSGFVICIACFINVYYWMLLDENDEMAENIYNILNIWN